MEELFASRRVRQENVVDMFQHVETRMGDDDEGEGRDRVGSQLAGWRMREI